MFSDYLDHILGVHKELIVLSFLYFFNALFALIYLMLVKDETVVLLAFTNLVPKQ